MNVSNAQQEEEETLRRNSSTDEIINLSPSDASSPSYAHGEPGKLVEYVVEVPSESSLEGVPMSDKFEYLVEVSTDSLSNENELHVPSNAGGASPLCDQRMILSSPSSPSSGPFKKPRSSSPPPKSSSCLSETEVKKMLGGLSEVPPESPSTSALSQKEVNNLISILSESNALTNEDKKTKYSSRSCAILHCPNPTGTSYHFFPSDERLRQIWIERCDFKKSFNPKKSRICGKHFTDNSFQYKSIREQLIPTASLRRRLKSDAVPSIDVTNDEYKLYPPRPPIQYVEVVGMDSTTKFDLQGEPDSEVEVKSSTLKLIHRLPESLSSAPVPVVSSNKKEKCKNPECRSEICSYKTKIRKLQRILKRERKSKTQDVNKIVVEKLREIGHSKSQVNFLMGKTNRPGNFTKEEVADFLILRTISLKAYQFLREKKLMCLPAPSTLHNWVKILK